MSDPSPAYFRLPIVDDNQLVEIIAAIISVAKMLEGGSRSDELLALADHLVKQSMIVVQHRGQ